MTHLLALVRLILLVISVPAMMVLILPFWAVGLDAIRRRLAGLTFRLVRIIFGMKVHCEGGLSEHRPLLVISNHCSYLDIIALGSSLPVAFTPKSEIRSWPVIGLCCYLAGCVFVERTPKAIQQTKAEIASKLQMGRVMCIFAEGTTNDGTHLKPFKSSLFSLAEIIPEMKVQPVALCYDKINGQRLDANGRAQLAWYDDMALVPHLWRSLHCWRIDVVLKPLATIDSDTHTSRKALCEASETAIRSALEQSYDHQSA